MLSAMHLHDAGYHPLPIKENAKHCYRKGWPSLDWSGSAPNIGLRLDGLAMIDIDLENAADVAAVARLLPDARRAPRRSRVNSTRIAYLVRCNDIEHARMRTGKWPAGRVEVKIGNGELILAFGHHPSGAALDWTVGSGTGLVEHNHENFPQRLSLPELTEGELRAFVGQCGEYLTETYGEPLETSHEVGEWTELWDLRDDMEFELAEGGRATLAEIYHGPGTDEWVNATPWRPDSDSGAVRVLDHPANGPMVVDFVARVKHFQRMYADKLDLTEEEMEAFVPAASRVQGLAYTQDGKVKQSEGNLILILGQDREFQSLCYDELRDRPRWKDRALKDRDGWDAAVHLQARYELAVPAKRALAGMEAVAVGRPVNTVLDRLKRSYEAWISDGRKRRLPQLLTEYFGADGSEPYLAAIGTKWMIGAVARGVDPGCKMDTMLVLHGDQGIGKSSGLQALCGKDPYGAPYCTELAAGARDQEAILRSSWIVEVAELSAFAARDVEHIKAMMSTQVNRDRRAYDRQTTDFPRRCAFVGTTNDQEYLMDSTGARRFWPVDACKVAVARLANDAELLWGEAYARYKNGESWWLEKTDRHAIEVLQAFQEETDAVTSYDPYIYVLTDWAEGRSECTYDEAATHVATSIHTGGGNVNSRRLGRALAHLGFRRRIRQVDGRRRRIYVKR